jgi:Flp pilus assembly protein TadD
MKRRLIIFGACVACLAAGCDQPAAPVTQAASYRTITTQPLRDTQTARTHNRQGLEHLAAGRFDKAADEFNLALTADVEFGPAHNNLGKVLFARKQLYEAAWEFDYACRLLPHNAEPHNNLGLVLQEAGQLDNAIEQFRTAVNMDPSSVEYAGNLAVALVRRGDRGAELRQLLERIIAEDDRGEWVIWARRQLPRAQQ